MLFDYALVALSTDYVYLTCFHFIYLIFLFHYGTVTAIFNNVLVKLNSE